MRVFFGMEKVSRIYDSPVGRLRIEATAEGICALTWPKDGGDGEVEKTVDSREIAIARQHLATCTDWLHAYFNGSLLESPVPKPPLVIPKKGTKPTISGLLLVSLVHTPFTGTFSHNVWSALCSTEVGEAVTYGQLANLAGNPSAARAVGQAMCKHSIPLLIPCHRVIKGGSGGIGNYSGGEGPATKQWLLEHERKMKKVVED